MLNMSITGRSYFNSRPSARGDVTWQAAFADKLHFNSRPSARGDADCPTTRMERLFQFTPLREGRPDRTPRPGASQSDFNSRPSARGDPPSAAPWSCPRHFNSRPSARGDSGYAPERNAQLYFNSRPSARGDKGRTDVIRGMLHISIHAPPRGATIRRVISPSRIRFQFTPLREGRQCVAKCEPRGLAISIHAPPRGATPGRSRLSSVGELKNFNSRPSARGDHPILHASCICVKPFQFTPLREGRRDGGLHPALNVDFNSCLLYTSPSPRDTR